MVAKSFQSCKCLGDPFSSHGKMYVMIEKSDGTTRRVRWYSDAEYARMYKEDPPKRFKTPREVFGFGPEEDGYITIFCGDTYPHKEYLKELPQTRYHNFWGWYIIQSDPLPDDCPSDIKMIPLYWNQIGLDNGDLKNESEIAAMLNSIKYEKDSSQYQGQKNERISVTVTVERNILLQGFNVSHMHIMRDANNNCYVWTTAAKNWEEGSVHNITGTIKDHRLYRNTQQTILTRCKEN